MAACPHQWCRTCPQVSQCTTCDARIASDSELDFQLMNTEQATPQHLCFMVLNSWVYLWDTTIGFGCYFLLVIGQHFSIQWGPTWNATLLFLRVSTWVFIFIFLKLESHSVLSRYLLLLHTPISPTPKYPTDISCLNHLLCRKRCKTGLPGKGFSICYASVTRGALKEIQIPRPSHWVASGAWESTPFLSSVPPDPDLRSGGALWPQMSAETKQDKLSVSFAIPPLWPPRKSCPQTTKPAALILLTYGLFLWQGIAAGLQGTISPSRP